jgi:hypothetical protein
MRSFETMNGDDLENQLRGMALRRPPAEWRSLLVPGPAWFPKPLALGLGSAWLAATGFVLATPREEVPDFKGMPEGVPLRLPREIRDEFLLGYYEGGMK